ncbi:peptide-binding protein [Niastella yeongjuensis]|uniref:Peptide-binding protein n=1 Tax=Niastella yeongjuensis TaxID=354355 RepID=A0A1V9EWI2_9BACT|nr:SH3 domain-containing protein [Niastella yeongjuensis]OQP50498.1 peptide-binding protein [Niastella yeongjuensis]SEN31780.1 SH3 domain-containing protein [Niastella yeongjuensis]
MALQDKYQQLLNTAKTVGIANLQVREQDNVLYIDGEAPNGTAKDSLWDIYGKLDPDFRSGDVVMNINVSSMAPGGKAKVTTDKSNLNIRKGPGTDQPIVGKAAHHEIVTLVSKTNDQWWLIRTDAGEEGYAYAQYLSPQS